MTPGELAAVVTIPVNVGLVVAVGRLLIIIGEWKRGQDEHERRITAQENKCEQRHPIHAIAASSGQD